MKRQLFWLLALLPVLIPVSSVNSQLPSSPPPVLAACYNATTSSWITISAMSSATPLLAQPPSTVGMYGKNSNGSYYPISCDSNGNILTNTFVQPVTANWTTLGSTGCTTSVISGPYGLTNVLQVLGTTTTTATCGYQIANSGTFSHIVAISGTVNQSNYSSILVGFTDGVKYESCGVGNNNFALGITGIAALTLTGTVGANNGGTGNGGSLTRDPYWFRLSATGGTNLKCEYSPDQGLTWIAIFNDTTPYLVPTALFFGTNQRGASGTSYAWLLSYQ